MADQSTMPAPDSVAALTAPAATADVPINQTLAPVESTVTAQPQSDSFQGQPLYDISGESPVLGDVPHDQVTAAVASGKYSFPKGDINVISPEGEHGIIPAEQATEAFNSGYKFATPNDLKEAAYNTTEQRAKTFAEGALSGVVGPFAAPIEKHAFDVNESDILNRKHINPGTHTAGEVGGLVGSILSGTGFGSMTLKAGELGVHVLPEIASIVTKVPALAKIGKAATQAAIENLTIQASDEVNNMLLHDPETAANSAMLARLGTAGALGGLIGGAVGAVSPLWEAAGGSKIGTFFRDMKSRADYHGSNPDPVVSVGDVLQKTYNSIDEGSKLLYEKGGLKESEIRKMLPEGQEAADKSFDMASDYHAKGNELIAKLVKDDANRGVINGVRDAVNNFEQSALEGSYSNDRYKIYDSINKFKQEIDGASRFGKGGVPDGALIEATNKVRDFGNTLRKGLEDETAWGKAGAVQKEINGAWSELQGKNGPLSQVRKTFMTNVNDDIKVDPGKVNTYLNQLGKPNAEIKQEKLLNFIEGHENFHNTIDGIYKRNGVENPLARESVETLKATTGDVTKGAQAMDWLLTKGAGKMAGATVGGLAGHGVGMGGLSAILGEHILGPLFNKVIPTATKAILSGASAPSIKASVDYAAQVAQGQGLLGKAVKGVFTAAREELPKMMQDNKYDRDKLDKKLIAIQQNPAVLQNVGGSIASIYPDHTANLAKIAGTAAQTINQLRPNVDKQSPLDNKPVVNKADQASYNRALDLAQNPLSIASKIRDGSVTAKDVILLKTMYPALYTNMSSKLLTEMNNHMAKGNPVPYRTKIGMSLFLGQPLDSSMKPANIISAQPNPQGNQAGSPQGGAKAPAASSVKGLSKLPSTYQTPEQSREAARNKH